MKGKKYDNGKPRWNLIDLTLVEEVVKVLTFGANKYDDNNWMKVPDAPARYFSAALRHITAAQRDEVYDEESGLPHLAHAICCLLFLRFFQKCEECYEKKTKNNRR